MVKEPTTPEKFQRTPYKIELEHADFEHARLLLEELMRLRAEHRMDVGQPPLATVSVELVPTDAEGQAALEAWLEEARLMLASMTYDKGNR